MCTTSKAKLSLTAGLLVTAVLVGCFSEGRVEQQSRRTSPTNKSFKPSQIDPDRSAPHSVGLRTANRQLAYTSISDKSIVWPANLSDVSEIRHLQRELPDRRIPGLVALSELGHLDLPDSAVPLPKANTLSHLNYQERRFGRLQTQSGELYWFNPEVLLIKFRSLGHVSALRVEPMREWEAVQQLAARADVEFAELDILQERQFKPSDPLITNQWHHARLNSFGAWEIPAASTLIRVAIVDTPFQMDHPDLAANTVSGWDAVANAPITASTGIVHSTLCAGLVAAQINNTLGVAGMAHCKILPININGAISEMYNAIVWAADHNVRVVNISWTGGDSAALQTAAQYLKSRARGLLAMSGGNGTGFLNYTNQPDIYCISMTDAADNLQSKYGPHIDFAAPGWQIYSTTTAGGYAYASGTSYSAPIFCGVVVAVFASNPAIGPDEAVGILRLTSRDKGPPGLDPYYGSGIIDFRSAVVGATPRILSVQPTNGDVVVSARHAPGLNYQLWRTASLAQPSWLLVGSPTLTNADLIQLTDSSPLEKAGFYRISVAVP